MDGESHDGTEPLKSREPSLEDLLELCRHLNAAGARYVVVGGWAIRNAGYARHTVDIDLIIDTSIENENRVRRALENLPDRAVDDMKPGEVEKFKVSALSTRLLSTCWNPRAALITLNSPRTW